MASTSDASCQLSIEHDSIHAIGSGVLGRSELMINRRRHRPFLPFGMGLAVPDPVRVLAARGTMRVCKHRRVVQVGRSGRQEFVQFPCEAVISYARPALNTRI